MAHSSIVDMAGWRSLAIQVGLVAVGALSFVVLFSFGGQLMVAPALLPVQWMIARHTDGWVSRAFAVLGSVLLAEAMYLGTLVVFGHNAPVAVAAGVVAIGSAIVFYRTSRDAR